MKSFIALSLSDVVFIMLINVKMPTLVGILTFMSRIIFVFSGVEHKKSFITSGADHWFIVFAFMPCGRINYFTRSLQDKSTLADSRPPGKSA